MLPSVLLFIFSADYISSYFEVYKQIKKSDAIVVLGGGIINNTLTRTSGERVHWAYHLYSKKVAPFLILSGGSMRDSNSYYSKDKSDSNQFIGRISESEIMYEYLKKFNIDKEKIIFEDRSYNTYTNFIQVEKILKSINANSIILVTNTPHTMRAYLTFKNSKCQVTPVSVPFSNFETLPLQYKLKFLIHEILGIIWYKIYYRI